jgi:hypothetical protein
MEHDVRCDFRAGVPVRQDGLAALYVAPDGTGTTMTAARRIRRILDEQPTMLVGENRPMTRLAVSRVGLKEYQLPLRTYRSWVGVGTNNAQEANTNWRELLPQTCRINQQLDSGIATCSITFQNISRATNPAEPAFGDAFMEEGYYTLWRGQSFTAQVAPNEWTYLLQPDRMIRTYQGYGADFSLKPWQDWHLIQTGVWLIDTVQYNADLSVSVECRDMAALLVDQMVYPPVVPRAQYPLEYAPRATVNVPGVPPTFGSTGGGEAVEPSQRISAPFQGSSNTPWIGLNGGVSGHYPSHAFDGNVATYWLSVGNGGPDSGWSFEWLQVNAGRQTVGSVKFLPWKGNYTVYLCIKIGGVWQGTSTVPYDANSGPAFPNGANTKYVLKTTCGNEVWSTINVPGGPKTNVESVRLTFTHLADSNIGTNQYRAGVREFQVFADQKGVTQAQQIVLDPGATAYSYLTGNVTDWTALVKDAVSIAGFWHPTAGTSYPSDADLTMVSGAPGGRAWGNFERAGVGPLVGLPFDVFDKKPLMDIVVYVKDVLGFMFLINGTGEVVWRLPNLWRTGSWVTTNFGMSYQQIIKLLDEDTNLLSLNVVLSNKHKRKTIAIGQYDGSDIAAAVPGEEFIPVNEVPLNATRDAFWFDQDFATREECIVMADMVKTRMAMNFRKGRSRIPADPTLEIDDQVIIVERTTSERYGHHVSGINSDWSADGTWTMELEHYWLYVTNAGGGTQWVVPFHSLHPVTQQYMTARGHGLQQ